MGEVSGAERKMLPESLELIAISHIKSTEGVNIKFLFGLENV